MKVQLQRILILPVLALLICACSQEQPPFAEGQSASPDVVAAVDRALAVAGVTEQLASAFSNKSIAVLPFTDLSENTDQPEYSYLSDGLSKVLIQRLATLPDLQVAGRESSFYYKNREEMPGVIGEALQVQHILLGSMRMDADNLQVTARLVSADDGNHIWSRMFDGAPEDVFAIQNEIVAEVVTALNVSVDADDVVISGMTRELGAYDKFLQALALYNRFSRDTVFRAISLLEDAVETDAGFGRAWWMLGSMYEESALILSQDQALDFSTQASVAFAQAAEQSPDMPELMLVEAGYLRDAGRFREAENLYQRFFDMYGDSLPRAMLEYGHMLARTGQFNEAIAMFDRARRIDPFAPRHTYQLAVHELIRGQLTKVRQLAAFGMQLDLGHFLFRSLEWEMAMREGELDRAAALIRAYLNSSENRDDQPISPDFLAEFADVLELNDLAVAADNINAFINNPAVTPLELGYVARLVALIGQPEIALDYFFSVEANAGVWDKVYDDMRRLPDFNRLLQEKGMVDYWRDTGNWGDFCVAAGGRDFVCK